MRAAIAVSSGLVVPRETSRVGVERQPAPDHLGPHVRVAGRADLNRQTEPVQQLGAQLALLRIHGPDQHEPGSVGDGHPVAFDGRPAHGRGVEQQVDKVVVQQIDLVDVQQAPVGCRQQAGLVFGDPGRQRLLQVQGSDHPVFGRADGQFHQPGRAMGRGARVVRQRRDRRDPGRPGRRRTGNRRSRQRRAAMRQGP